MQKKLLTKAKTNRKLRSKLQILTNKEKAVTIWLGREFKLIDMGHILIDIHHPCLTILSKLFHKKSFAQLL